MAMAIGLALALRPDPARATDLTELYTRARRFDPRLQTAQYQVQIAEEAVGESRANRLPVVNASAQQGRVRQDVRSSDTPVFQVGRTEYSSTDLSLSLTQPIFHAEYNAAMDEAQAGLRQARFDLSAEEQDLVFRVAKAHFDYLAALSDVEFAQAERQAIDRQLEVTEERLAAGLANITAVHEARARSALARTAEIDAAGILESARQAIAEITGSVPDDLKRLSEAVPLVRPDQPDVEAWVGAALFRNPRVKALEAQAEGLEEEFRRQHSAARVPVLDLVGTTTDNDTGGSEFGGGREILNTTVALRLTIPIYDGGRGSAAVRGTALRRRQALERIEAERRRVERETRETFLGTTNGILRVQALSQTVFFQEATVSEKEEGLRSGLSTGREVLDARRDLFSARRDLARARFEQLLNGIKLKQSAGMLSPDDLKQIDAFLQ